MYDTVYISVSIGCACVCIGCPRVSGVFPNACDVNDMLTLFEHLESFLCVCHVYPSSILLQTLSTVYIYVQLYRPHVSLDKCRCDSPVACLIVASGTERMYACAHVISRSAHHSTCNTGYMLCHEIYEGSATISPTTIKQDNTLKFRTTTICFTPLARYVTPSE